jgi:DNA-binding NarL/FixJ family response regulator
VFRLVVAVRDDARALPRMLAAVEGVDVVGTTTDAPGVLELVRRTRPDFVVVDLAMPPDRRLAVVGAVARERPRTRVVLCAETGGRIRLVPVATAGARGCLRRLICPAAGRGPRP